MQLFTIGLNQLHPDGTLKLDPSGVPIPTYDQKTITEVAKVFTGWAFASDTTNVNNFRGAAANYLAPMVLFPTFHEDGPKTIFNGIQIPANQGGAKDLKDMLDALVNHANTGPFISRQLIQRLITSNPSPGYVYRVAQAFADDGTGTRGNLGAVVHAILTDYEARSGAVAATASFGKLKEPLLRATALLRSLEGASNLGRYANAPFHTAINTENTLGQAPSMRLRSPISSSRISFIRAPSLRPVSTPPSIRFSTTRRPSVCPTSSGISSTRTVPPRIRLRRPSASHSTVCFPSRAPPPPSSTRPIFSSPPVPSRKRSRTVS